MPENHKFYTNRTDFPNYEQGRLYLNRDGCEHFCGEGWQYWPANEIGLRLGIFVLPLLGLGLAFSIKPDLAFGTQVFTFFHLVGDPIDSLWSVLIRQEAARRNYAFSAEMVPSAPREVAAILTAYDQWWQDARGQFEKQLIEEKPSTLADELTNGSNIPPKRHEMDMLEPPDAVSRRSRPRRIWDQFWPICGRVREAKAEESQRIRGVTKTSNLTLEEINEIRRIAQRLAANRSRKWIQTWFSIIFFLISVCAGYLRAVETYEKRKNSQTAHTLALVTLFAFLIFAVYINGHVGNFDREEEVLNTINELRTSRVTSLGQLFPQPRHRVGGAKEFDEYFEDHKRVSAYAGIVNHWRPDKHLRPHDLDDRSIWLLLTASCFAVLVSYGAALVISYRTPTIGFGCRSLAWTTIMGAWVVNAIFDIPGEIFKWDQHERFGWSTKVLWYFSYTRDIVVTMGIIVAIVMVQLGIMNTCWCRAGLTANPTMTAVEFGPPTDQMRHEGTLLWLCTATVCVSAMFSFIAYAGLDGENGRLLFVRSQAESMAEQRGIRMEKKWLEECRSTTSQEATTDDTNGTKGQQAPQLVLTLEEPQEVDQNRQYRESLSTPPTENDSLMDSHSDEVGSMSARSHRQLLEEPRHVRRESLYWRDV